MSTRRLGILAALLLALLLTVSIGTDASAAPAAQKPAVHPATLKFIGTRSFTPTQASPNDSLAVNNPRANRPIPRSGVTAAQVTIPTASPLPISNTSPAQSTTIKGLNGYDQRYSNGFNVTPPDQGLCANSQFAVEPVNIVMAVYGSNGARLTGDMSLATFFGHDLGTFTVGDPRCYWDPDTQRWFITVYDSDFSTYAGVDIAVSRTSDPRLDYYEYFLDTMDTGQPNCPCFGDQPLLGANRDAIFVSTNQYGFSTGFNGANVYTLDKKALSLGVTANAAFMRVGLEVPTPEDVCCFYTLQPSEGANGVNDTNRGGTEYFLSSGDFTGAGDNRIFAWALTNTSSIKGLGTPSMDLVYMALPSISYAMPLDNLGNPIYMARQRDDGLIPAGRFYYGASTAGPITPNDDRMNQVLLSNGELWGGLNTNVTQNVDNQIHVAVAGFGVKTTWNSSGIFTPSIAQQGYVAAAREDVLFPSVSVVGSGSGLINFTLTGPDYYPSTAYAPFTTTTKPTKVLVAAMGQSSLDDFCEYLAANCAQLPAPNQGLRPRFGDYSAAVVVGSRVVFANEYVQYPDCNVDTFAVDHTCGDTRGNRINWGTSISSVAP